MLLLGYSLTNKFYQSSAHPFILKKEKEKRKEKVHIPYKTKNASTQHVCNPKRLDSSPIKKKKKSTVYSTYMFTIIFEREKSKRKKHIRNFSV